GRMYSEPVRYKMLTRALANPSAISARRQADNAAASSLRACGAARRARKIARLLTSNPFGPVGDLGSRNHHSLWISTPGRKPAALVLSGPFKLSDHPSPLKPGTPYPARKAAGAVCTSICAPLITGRGRRDTQQVPCWALRCRRPRFQRRDERFRPPAFRGWGWLQEKAAQLAFPW